MSGRMDDHLYGHEPLVLSLARLWLWEPEFVVGKEREEKNEKAKKKAKRNQKKKEKEEGG